MDIQTMLYQPTPFDYLMMGVLVVSALYAVAFGITMLRLLWRLGNK